MVKTRYLVALIVAASVMPDCASATDDEIRRCLVRSMLYIDNVNGARQDFRYARELCGEDTNRFARLLCELAHTNDSWIAGGMIRSLGGYGTSEQLPFLYSQVSNTAYGADAVRSILRIEGVTSNSVAIVDSYLSNTNIYPRERSELCGMFFANVMSTNLSSELRRSVEEVSLRYARSSNMYFRRMDRAMTVACPSYENSKRRLAVLRSVYQLGVSEYQIAYVTNAINELVAYPEADLPE